MNLPSVKTLAEVTSYPKELRKLLEIEEWDELEKLANTDKPFGDKSQFGDFKATLNWLGSHYNSPRFNDLKMQMADELCETCGVEYIGKGHNAKSPAITYCNAGDPYTATLLLVRGRFSVGGWGGYVEQGNYE